MSSGFEFTAENAFRIVNKHLKFKSQVGYFMDSPTYPDGKMPGFIARLMEFGVPHHNIPSRPFMDQTIKRNRDSWSAFIRKKFRGQEFAYPLATQFCEKVKDDIKTEIEIGDFVANSSVTIRRKKSARPLIDSGHLMESISYKIQADI